MRNYNDGRPTTLPGDEYKLPDAENKFFKYITPILFSMIIGLIVFIWTSTNSMLTNQSINTQSELEKDQEEIANIFANQTIINSNLQHICRALNTFCNDTVPLLPNLTLK